MDLLNHSHAFICQADHNVELDFQSRAAMLANVAELGAERMKETIGKANYAMQRSERGSRWTKCSHLTGQLPRFGRARNHLSVRVCDEGMN